MICLEEINITSTFFIDTIVTMEFKPNRHCPNPQECSGNGACQAAQMMNTMTAVQRYSELHVEGTTDELVSQAYNSPCNHPQMRAARKANKKRR